MSVEDTETLDAIGLEEATGTVTLTIADHLTWDDTAGHLELLARKLEAYVQFVESGQLVALEPRAVGRKVLVQVYAHHPLPQTGAEFFAEAEATLSLNSIGFRWLLFPGH